MRHRSYPSIFGKSCTILIVSTNVLIGFQKGSADAAPIGNFASQPVNPTEEAALFTPAGFAKPGKLAVAEGAEGAEVGRLKLTVRDQATGQPTPCRVNVVGPDGNYYQPDHDLKLYGFTDNWPQNDSRGNRPGKGPFRYLGWFFYSRGEDRVAVPAGQVRVEVWKGFEYRPTTLTTTVAAGETRAVELILKQTLPMRTLGYHAGDPHIHVPRMHRSEDELALDLMEAAGIYYGSILCYNEPPGPYSGLMNTQDMPQRFLGIHSLRGRSDHQIVSGQEYRSGLYGHLNVHMRDELVLKNRSVDADDGPVYGELSQQVRDEGGLTVYAHGGYALEVYADAVQEHVDAVEMLQFSKYRGIGLQHWYHLHNAGFRIPMTGASDYPACRFLGDCKTYVHHEALPGFGAWYQGMAAGQSFVTSGPMLLLEVDGRRPGATILRQSPGTHQATLRVSCEVAPVTHLQLIVGGRVAKEVKLRPNQARGNWFEIEHSVELDRSSWIAARAFSKAPSGSADAESHTNPIFIIHNGKAPYERESAAILLKELERQIAHHQSRTFEQKERTLAYFLKSKDILQEVIRKGGRAFDEADRQASRADDDLNAKAAAGDENALRRVLQSNPGKSAEEALAALETSGPFQLDLVASEPQVRDPICAAIDENGLLYVGEMIDYPYAPREGEPALGGVVVLEDADDDGRYERSTRFADDLLWAAGIAPWQGGVYVAAPPDIWYLKDVDGDRRADVRRRVFSGFGKQNQQGMLNNLKWGPDGKIYGSSSVNGGAVHHVGDPDARPVVLDGHDFRFDPRTERLEAISGTKQFGNTFDDWGNRFVCSQGEPLLQVVLPQRYLARNPYLPAARTLHSLAPSPTPVFRISPIEMWREIRSRRRILANRSPATGAGVSHHVIDAGAGVTVYRGGAFPNEYYGNVFVGGAQNNLVHRRVLESQGSVYASHRGDKQGEIVRSTDNWFRPVNFLNAPDGTLYVLDMAREILEAIHIPLDVVKHLALKNGRDRGRIYRMAPRGFTSPPQPRLSAATTAELVAALESPHSWRRDTASRLLFERQDKRATMPLQRLAAASPSAVSRFAALWSLRGLDALTTDAISRALGDDAPQIRKAALRLSEPFLEQSSTLREQVLALAVDPSPVVRLQLALTLGETDDPRAINVLADLVKRFGDDYWLQTAVLSSTSNSTDRVLAQLLRDSSVAASKHGPGILQQMAMVVGARDEQAPVQRTLAALADLPQPDLKRSIVCALGDGLKRAGKRLDAATVGDDATAELVTHFFDEAESRIADDKVNPNIRRQAIAMLGLAPLTRSWDGLSRLLSTEHPLEIQLAALDALGGYPDLRVAEILLASWPALTPEMLDRALAVLLSRESWTLSLLNAAADRQISLATLDNTQRSLLLKHSHRQIAELAQRVVGQAVTTPRDKVIEGYQTCLSLVGDATNGERVFTSTCAACHSLGGQGHAVGPDLTSVGSLDPAATLVHILDPNRYVLPKYLQYVVRDLSGRIYTGVVGSQTATSVTLLGQEGKSETILRAHIEEIRATDVSLMPEALEERISPQEMADLMEFMTVVRRQYGKRPANDVQVERDVGTLPGLVEPE